MLWERWWWRGDGPRGRGLEGLEGWDEMERDGEGKNGIYQALGHMEL